MAAPGGTCKAPARWQPAARPCGTEEAKYGKKREAKYGNKREEEPDITFTADGNKPLSGSTAVNCAGDSFAAAHVAARSLQRNCLLWACKNERKCARRLCACCRGPGVSQQRKPMHVCECVCASVCWSQSLCSVHPGDLGMRLVPQGGKGSRDKYQIGKRGQDGAEDEAGESMPKPGSRNHPSPLAALSRLSLAPLLP